jgi:hypothetical protein
MEDDYKKAFRASVDEMIVSGQSWSSSQRNDAVGRLCDDYVIANGETPDAWLLSRLAGFIVGEAK